MSDMILSVGLAELTKAVHPRDIDVNAIDEEYEPHIQLI